MQLSRAFTLVFGGGLGSAIARALRSAIGAADRTVRREELFGKYRVLKKIGSGSGGSVHEAVYCPEGGFERRVAIKQLHPNLLSEQSFVDGFRAEAELGARLAHPNVVMIHDFGRSDETFFMAMEYVDGLPLSRLSHRAKAAGVTFAPEIVAHVGRSVLRALEHAHEGVRDASGQPLRVLHRDVCPQNIMVSRIGEVKLTDFGIARVLGQASETSTRTIAGHEAYLAPEQIEGRASIASDLFAVAIVLWELVTGKRLFARDNPAATLLAIMAANVPKTGGAAWDAFFDRALARDPSRRFGSAREMLEGLPQTAAEAADASLGALVVRFASSDGAPDASDSQATIKESPTSP
jgi:serine/threonine-protein kinase